jgi:hypothetical protein
VVLVVPMCFVQCLKDRVIQLIPEKQKQLKEINTTYGSKSLGEVTVAQVGFLRRTPVVHFHTVSVGDASSRCLALDSALAAAVT